MTALSDAPSTAAHIKKRQEMKLYVDVRTGMCKRAVTCLLSFIDRSQSCSHDGYGRMRRLLTAL